MEAGDDGREEHTDRNASANGIFRVAASERAILWVRTLGQSWDVARCSPLQLMHLGEDCLKAHISGVSWEASPQCKQRGRLLQALLK